MYHEIPLSPRRQARSAHLLSPNPVPTSIDFERIIDFDIFALVDGVSHPCAAWMGFNSSSDSSSNAADPRSIKENEETVKRGAT
jgi:hypothetical protein